MRITDQCTTLLDAHLDDLKDWLTLDHEVGGYIVLSENEFKLTVNGDKGYPMIQRMECFPFDPSIGKLDWHTHNNSIPNHIDGLPHGSERVIGSDTDILTLLQCSVAFGQPCVSVVISKCGYFFMTPMPDFVQHLCNKTKDELEKIYEKRIREDLGAVNYDFFFTRKEKSLEERIDRFIREMKKIYTESNRTYGILCRMVFRDLNISESSQCLIM